MVYAAPGWLCAACFQLVYSTVHAVHCQLLKKQMGSP